jgi:hypothetical protein
MARCRPTLASQTPKMDLTFTGFDEQRAREQYQVAADQLAVQGWYPVAETASHDGWRLFRDLAHVTVTFERSAGHLGDAPSDDASDRPPLAPAPNSRFGPLLRGTSVGECE